MPRNYYIHKFGANLEITIIVISVSRSCWKIQPDFRDEKRPKILGTSFGAKSDKQNKDGETQLSYYFSR